MATAPPLWTKPADELIRFATTIGLPANLQERRDDVRFYEENLGTQKFSSDETQLQNLDSAFTALRNKYGPALAFQFKTGDLELNQENYTPAKLQEYCNQIAGAPVRASLKINKQVLADYWELTNDATDTRLFIDPAALEAALDRSLFELEHGEDALLEDFDGSKKLMIVVPALAVDLKGECLAVLGGDAILQWKEFVSAGDPAANKARIDLLYQVATGSPRWTDLSLHYLTPLQLSVAVNPAAAGAANVTTQLLCAHWLACNLLYLATFCKKLEGVDTGAYEATFAADKYLAVIPAGTTAEIANTLTTVAPANPWQAPTVLGGLVEWAYQEEAAAAVRLKVLQEVVASLLQDTPHADRLAELIRKVGDVNVRVQSRWEGFLDDKLDKYFSDLKALEETVEATIKSYNEQVQSLSKTLTENILAAVGVIVGSFLAAIFTTPFRAHVFVFGTVTYLIYLIVFPVAIGLYSAYDRYKDQQDAFNKRKQDLGNRMRNPALVEQTVRDSVTKRERWFRNWFDFTVGLYGVVIMFMLLAILTVPGKIEQWTDDFALTDVFYSKPLNGETVPLTILGANFDKDRQIVVKVGDATFTNAGEESLKVHGSTVLTLSPTRKDLNTLATKGSLRIRQGSSGEHTLQLPSGALPNSPDPVFRSWNWVVQKDRGTLDAEGSNFDSIAEVTLNGTKRDFQVSADHQKITIPDLAAKPQPAEMKLLLTDGRQPTVAVKLRP